MQPDSGDMRPLTEAAGFDTAGHVDTLAYRNGQRINLSKMQRQVQALSGTRDCVAFAIPGPGAVGDHVVLAVESDLPEASIHYDIRRLFPPSERPDLLCVSYRLPRTASGQLALDDLRALALDKDARFTPV